MNTNSNSSKNPSQSFREFESQVNDVWNIDDLDDTFGVIVNTKVSMQVAQDVLKRHSDQNKKTYLLNENESSDLSSISHTKDDEFNSKNDNKPRKSSSSSSTTSSSVVVHSHKLAPGMGIRLNQNRYSCGPQSQILPQNEVARLKKFYSLIAGPVSDLESLKSLSWSGIPMEVRHTVWKLLVNYMPLNVEIRESVISLKRKQYFEFVEKYAECPPRSKNDMENQIQKDLTRMSAIHEKPDLQKIFQRILCIWSWRHPASGYVQGFNDLVLPFFVVFLSEYVRVDLDTSQDLILTQKPTEEQFNNVEADSFWCFSTLLDGIQDRYTFAQPGIQRAVIDMASLVCRRDQSLHNHLMNHRVEYLQFAFRWMNNLLMRELPLRCVIRLWDTYQSEEQGFSKFHVYVCVALLLYFKNDLEPKKDFQSLMLFLQNLPTCQWTDVEISLILAEGYHLQCLFAEARHHLTTCPPSDSAIL